MAQATVLATTTGASDQRLIFLALILCVDKALA
jgi:hypothetical protein